MVLWCLHQVVLSVNSKGDTRKRFTRSGGLQRWEENLKGMDPDDIETEIIYGKQKKTHPDGGYGWLVVFCGFSVQFITVGMQNSSGTMLPALLKEYNQSEGATGELLLTLRKT